MREEEKSQEDKSALTDTLSDDLTYEDTGFDESGEDEENPNQETMETDGKRRFSLPKIGMRNLKTAISATLCAVIYVLIGRNPTFACIGAVFGMDNDIAASKRTGGNRLIGTVIGGFMGMGLFFLQQLFPYKGVKLLILFFGIMLLIYISQLVRAPGAIQAGSVVFYIVMLNTPEDQYVSYALNRMLDTAVGVVMSLCINLLLPRERLERLLPWVYRTGSRR